ncbi:MAG: hypothetical protein HY744_25740, partial [Deltaproteobacteria bacterium]|nr:hypothetical protein [Deltaproteobacteria bacterium]
MAWSLLLFFSFQTRGGALYSQLGTPAALFMVGLALGGAWSALRAARSAVRPGLLLRAQAVALGGAVLLALVLAALGSLGAGQSSLAALHALLLVVAGASTGVVFPAAASALLDRGAPPPAAAALVELADHAGAALAALATAVLLVPLLGLTKAAALLVAVQALALAQSAAAQRAGGRGRGQP